MAEFTRSTMKTVYEARKADGELYGAIAPRDWDRFRQTLRYIPRETGSLLDAGCDRGHWLDFVLNHRKIPTSLGVDISDSRIEEAKLTYPHLTFKSGFLETMDIPHRSYDVVTCLEVLEHIPEWTNVLERLLSIARKRVVITVPYKETIRHTVCIHCGEVTPMYGHLRRYDEATFPQISGFRVTFGYIKDYGRGANMAGRIYRMFRPRRSWLVACYDASMA